MIAIVASPSLTLSLYFIRFTYVLFLSVCTFYLYAFYFSSLYFLLYKHTGVGGGGGTLL